MSDMWAKISETWDILKPPLRPHPEVVRAFEREIDTNDTDIVLLGVTPEFARWGKTMIAVDLMPNMIGALWIGDDATRRAVVGNWADLPLEDNSCDAVVGDGCLGVLPNRAVRLDVLGQIARVLRPDGRAAIRLFTRSETPETLAAIKEDALAGRIKAIAELVLRVSLVLAPPDCDGTLKMSAVLDAINEMFPDRDALLAAAGWQPNVFSLIETYKNSDTVCTWADGDTIAEEASRHFGEVQLVSSGDYPVAQSCPLLILSKPLQ